MPMAAPKPCGKVGCTKFATKKGRCDLHQVKPWSHGKSRHERGYGANWDKLRKVILERDDHLCQNCKRSGIFTQAKEVDHITPKANGGTDDFINLQSLCKSCHHAKTIKERQNGRYS